MSEISFFRSSLWKRSECSDFVNELGSSFRITGGNAGGNADDAAIAFANGRIGKLMSPMRPGVKLALRQDEVTSCFDVCCVKDELWVVRYVLESCRAY